MDLAGRSAIVTGGAGGLGAATVRRLVGLGAGVAILDQAGDRAAELAKELGDTVVAVGGDVDDDVGTAIAAAQSVGTLSVVVNIAGRGVGGGRTVGRGAKLHDMGAFVTTMEMNAFGTFNATRLAAAAMAGDEPDESGQRGVVVNTGSIAGMEGQAGQVALGGGQGRDPGHDPADGPRPGAGGEHQRAALRLRQGGPQRLHRRPGRGLRAERAGQRHPPRPVPHRRHQGLARRGPRGLVRAAGPPRGTRGDRAARPPPGQRGVELHHRRHHPRRRRHHPKV